MTHRAPSVSWRLLLLLLAGLAGARKRTVGALREEAETGLEESSTTWREGEVIGLDYGKSNLLTTDVDEILSQLEERAPGENLRGSAALRDLENARVDEEHADLEQPQGLPKEKETDDRDATKNSTAALMLRTGSDLQQPDRLAIDYSRNSLQPLDKAALVIAMVVGLLFLPLVLTFRWNARFRNAVLELSGKPNAAAVNKRRGSELNFPDLRAMSKLTGASPSLASSSPSDPRFHAQMVGIPLAHSFKSVLSSSDVDRLGLHLPVRLSCKDWQLLYATEIHGFNLQTAYRKCAEAGPSMVVVVDANRYVMVGFSSETISPSSHGGAHFFGSGECFVASVYPEFVVHRWRPGLANTSQYVLANDNFLAFGGTGVGSTNVHHQGFALWLDSTFERGTSEANATFGNTKTLASSEAFQIISCEIWGFAAPMSGIRNALQRTAFSTVSAAVGRLAKQASATAVQRIASSVGGGNSSAMNTASA